MVSRQKLLLGLAALIGFGGLIAWTLPTNQDAPQHEPMPLAAMNVDEAHQPVSEPEPAAETVVAIGDAEAPAAQALEVAHAVASPADANAFDAETPVAQAPAADAIVTETAAQQTSVEIRPVPEPEVAAEAEPESAATPASALEQALPSPVAPQLLNLRVEADGWSVIAGRGAADSDIAVLINGTEMALVRSDAGGAFFAFPQLGYSETPRLLSFVQDPEGQALVSPETYVIAANPAPAEMAPQTTAQTDETVAEPEAEQNTAQNTGPVLAVADDGVRVVQPAVAADVSPDVMDSVSLDAITYDQSGDISLQGRASDQGFVQIYVDNTPVTRLPVDEAGRWRTALPDVDTGVYTLRIDEVSAAGDVISRIETPLLREDPADLVEVMADETAQADFAVASRIVQPGATLWAIAEERYGSGIQYVKVFEANRDRIRDPDLIYPGQVFDLPADQN